MGSLACRGALTAYRDKAVSYSGTLKASCIYDTLQERKKAAADRCKKKAVRHEAAVARAPSNDRKYVAVKQSVLGRSGPCQDAEVDRSATL